MVSISGILGKYGVSAGEVAALEAALGSAQGTEGFKAVLNGKVADEKLENLVAELVAHFGSPLPSKSGNGCQAKCQLCDKSCAFNLANHQALIDAKDPQVVNFVTPSGKSVAFTAHLCGDTHSCQEACASDGICEIKVKQLPQVPGHASDSYAPLNIEQVGSKQKCKQVIPPFSVAHTNVHLCNAFSFHRCPIRCPECLNYCTKDPGHTGLHTTEHSVKKGSFTSNLTVPYIKNQKKIAAAPTPNENFVTCSSFCSELARGHYHLKPCQNKTDCAAKTDQGLRHHDADIPPAPGQHWDEILCDAYWAESGFEVPVAKHLKEKISKCTHVCALPECQAKPSYCIWKNWHKDEHLFMCSHDKVYFTNLDVAFVCDVTGSMSSYIEASKNTIKRIMKVFKNMLDDESRIKFAFIGYRDHPPQDSSFVTQIKNFSDETTILDHLKNVSAAGGGDTPEAVIDGINDAAHNISWRSDSMKFVFHVLDAPGHGKDWCNTDDGFPNGCPCKLDIEKIGKKLGELKIRYKCMKIGSSLELTMKKLKGAIPNLEVTELDKASQMEIVVTEIMTRDVMNATS